MITKKIREFSITAENGKSYNATLPATVYSVLLDNNLVENPFIGNNIKNPQTAIPDSCVFSSDIILSEAEISVKHIYLRLKGIYAKAEIVFNERSYGAVGNVNRVYIFDITDRAVAGVNKLEIKCLRHLGYKIPMDENGDPLKDYDEAPNIPDMGIIGDVEILATDSAFISAVRLSQTHSESRVDLGIKFETIGDKEDIRVIATLMSPTGKIYLSGISEGVGKISVPDPELWWPASLGKPSLYKLTVTLYKGDMAQDSYERLIGLRDIKIVREGNVPAVSVNGSRIFSMGATYVKENAILPYVSKSSTERLLKAALRSNMNTIRLSCNGLTPPEYFYDMCDKLGLLVWQDISIYYIAPPAASVFAAGLTDAIADTIDMAVAHPSVALMYLCFTETEGGFDAKTSGEISDYRGVCMNILNPVLEKCAMGVEFISDESELRMADERYVFDELKTLPTFPDLRTLGLFAERKDMNPSSEVIELHSSGHEGIEKTLLVMSKTLRFPYGLEDYIYASNFAAAYRVASSVKKCRSQLENITSAVYRQLNDSWPAITPSMFDFFGKEKAMAYRISSAYDSVIASVDVHGEECSFFVSNENKKNYVGKLMFALYDRDGKCHFETTRDVTVSPCSSSVVAKEDMSSLIGSRKNDYYIIYELYDANGVNSSGVELITMPRFYNFGAISIKYEVTGIGTKFNLKLSSSAYALGVFVEFEGIDAKLDKNYVDLLPSAPVAIRIETERDMSVEELVSKLKIRNAADIGNEK